MKPLLLAALLACSVLALAQTVPPAGTKAAGTSKAQTSQTQPAPTSQMTELDYYKKLAEQSKADADRAHSDIMTGYEVNVGTLVALALTILAVQFFNVKSELEKSENLVRSSVADINTALETTQSNMTTELAGLRREFEELQRIMLERLSQETTNRTDQIDATLSDLGDRYGNRIMNLEVKNQSRKFDTRPFHRLSVTPAQVAEIVKDNSELEQLIKLAIGKAEAGITPENDEINAIGKKIVAMQEINSDSHDALRNLIQKISLVNNEFWRKLTLLEASVTIFAFDRSIGQKKYYKLYKSDGLSQQFEDVDKLFT